MITKKTTNELLKILSSIDSKATLQTFSEELRHSEKPLSFSEFLFKKIQEKGFTPGRLWEEAQIQRNYGYQILNGTKAPGRDKVLALCLSLNLSLEETQRALALANAGALYPRRKRDSILIFSLEKSLSVPDTNILLFDFSEELLS
ncbi:MAG: XRE family transcriptional regulator [Dorea sp.]|nr:XRE family transcriptional regulator [Dorea sp.]